MQIGNIVGLVIEKPNATPRTCLIQVHDPTLHEEKKKMFVL
jgi:hypothetical protein